MNAAIEGEIDRVSEVPAQVRFRMRSIGDETRWGEDSSISRG